MLCATGLAGEWPQRFMNAWLHSELEEKAAELQRLCEECNVVRLDIFGSATRPRFDSDRSDLDFLVTFRPDAIDLDHYLRLAEGLERLFHKPVDLVIDRSIRNPYFRRSVDATRRLIYARREQEAAV